MGEVTLRTDDRGRGSFTIESDGKRIGTMMFEVTNGVLKVYHTEVAKEEEGKGFARKLFDAMVEYARAHHLTINPVCPYSRSLLERHPDLYRDVYNPAPGNG